MKRLRGIRFQNDTLKWLLEGVKTTTFRKNPRKGLYEVIKGGFFTQKRLGIIVECVPIMHTSAENVIEHHYQTEGDFKSPEEFRNWLKRQKLPLPKEGCLIAVKVVKR